MRDVYKRQEILEEFDQKHMVLVFRLLAKEEAAETFSYMDSDTREDLDRKSVV